MSQPIVFISHHRIKEGKLDGFKQYFPEGANLIEASKPGTVVTLAYLNEAGTEASVIHVFPDAEAMEQHMQGVGERANAAYEFLEPRGYEIYGRPSDQSLAVMKQFAASGIPLNVNPQPLGGYLRLKSG